MLLCYVDGKFVKPEDAKLPLSDLIIQRGVGVFEVIASQNLRPLLLTPHMNRFIKSAKSSGIANIPDLEFMKNIVREGILKVNQDVRVKIYLTGGDFFDESKGCFTNPRFFAIFEEAGFLTPEEFNKGVNLYPVPFGRDDPTVKSVDYRTTYKLPADSYEILYCPEGEITEAGHSTFFLVLKNNIGMRICFFYRYSLW